MLVIVKTLHNIFKLLNSETAPAQLAAGVAFGMMIGLSPTLSLHNLILFLVVCLFRINFSMFFVSFGVFSILGWALDPLWDRLGYWVLVDWTSARPLWIKIASTPILPYFRFNNTIVMGSIVAGIILGLPIFFIAIRGVVIYRARWRERVMASRAMVFLKASRLYGFYENYQKAKAKLGLV